jgi:hypothetical protein
MLIRTTTAVWALALAWPAFAQHTGHAGHAAPAPAAPTVVAPAAAASTPAPGGNFPSAFKGYRRFADEPTQDWKAANARVAQIGGWRAYAAEAAGAHAGHDAAASSRVPASPASPAQPALSPATKPRPGHARHH